MTPNEQRSHAGPAMPDMPRIFVRSRSCTHNLGNAVRTTQAKQATKPAMARRRCERHSANEQSEATTPLIRPASKKQRTRICVASFPGNAKSTHQQSVQAMK